MNTEQKGFYEIQVELQFSAAHFHPGYPGKCSNLHGHNYSVIIFVRADELDDMGMVCDFLLVKKEAGKLIEEFDHTSINDHKDFQNLQPSSENLAQYFYDRLQTRLNCHRYWLHAVQIGETDSTAAKYFGK